MNMTACLCGNEFPTHTSAGRVQCYTCSAARNQHTVSTRELVAAMWDVIPRLSCAEIGRRMVPELSKSAVIGIAHRMGLAVRKPANARWGPGKVRLPRGLRAHVAFGGALPTGAVSLPVLESTAISHTMVGAAATMLRDDAGSCKATETEQGPRRGPVEPDAQPRVAPALIAAAPQKKPQAPKPAKRQCEWLSGDKPFVRCSEGAEQGYPYCAAHCRVAYIGWRRDRQALACVAA